MIRHQSQLKTIYVDMDGVLADFDKRIEEITGKPRLEVKMHDVINIARREGFFENLELFPGALDGFTYLTEKFNVYMLSTPLWSSPKCWSEKRIWVENKLGKVGKKRLILCHNKGLLSGDYLIDDRTVNGVEDFKGKHIHFGQQEFPNWEKTIEYFKNI